MPILKFLLVQDDSWSWLARAAREAWAQKGGFNKGLL